MKSTRPAHTWGEADATQSLRKAFFCSVQPSCVHDRERPRESSVSIPAHFARILAPYSRERQVLSQRVKTSMLRTERFPAREKTCSILASCDRWQAVCLKTMKCSGKRSRNAHIMANWLSKAPASTNSEKMSCQSRSQQQRQRVRDNVVWLPPRTHPWSRSSLITVTHE
jgi:hypothetical protein